MSLPAFETIVGKKSSNVKTYLAAASASRAGRYIRQSCRSKRRSPTRKIALTYSCRPESPINRDCPAGSTGTAWPIRSPLKCLTEDPNLRGGKLRRQPNFPDFHGVPLFGYLSINHPFVATWSVAG